MLSREKIHILSFLLAGFSIVGNSQETLQATCRLDCQMQRIQENTAGHHCCPRPHQKIARVQKINPQCKNCIQTQNAPVQLADPHRVAALSHDSVAQTSAVDFSHLAPQSEFQIPNVPSQFRRPLTITLQRLLI